MPTSARHAPLVLLVSGSADDRDRYSAALRAARFVVAEAADGDRVGHVTRAQPNIVVIDLIQPERFGDAIDLTRRLRQDDRTSDLPIILLSRLPALADELAADRVGADRVLPKPCPPDALTCEVRRVIAARRRQSFRGDGRPPDGPSAAKT